MTMIRRTLAASTCLGMTLLIGACAGVDTRPGDAPDRISQCKTGDQQVASEASCLQDDAACYALANGDWCTGERGGTCPTGSAAVAAGSTCPPGARCFEFSESLTCAITVN